MRLRNSTCPVAFAPCTWNTCFAMSKPIVVACFMDASFVAVRHRHLGTQMPSGGVPPITRYGAASASVEAIRALSALRRPMYSDQLSERSTIDDDDRLFGKVD